jgi:hypothetical protein
MVNLVSILRGSLMPKTRKARQPETPIDYYKGFDRITKWKLGLSVVAFLVATIWLRGLSWDLASGTRWTERSRQLASHGPLTRAHAPWELQCGACHTSSGSIGMSQAEWATGLFGDSTASDSQCKKCHAGPIHHAIQQPLKLSCASCHHEHQGRDASLVRIADRHCTQCHDSLTAHTTDGTTTRFHPTIPRFEAGVHPDFRAISKPDPGSLKFSHARHLALGMASDDGGPVQTLDMLAESDRARYQAYVKEPQGWIQLDCAACHRLDGEDFALPVRPGPARSNGAYLLPVTYKNQCRACHPLEFDKASPTPSMAHGLQPDEVYKSLWKTYAARYLSSAPSLPERQIPPRPLPGRPEAPERQEARQAIERQVRAAEQILFGPKKCGECHEYETTGQLPVSALDHWDAAHPVWIKPTKVPEIWLESAVFDHSVHRAVRCSECHERADRESKHVSGQSSDVLLPSIEVCLKCHSPSRLDSDGISRLGGASVDCTECHRYHNADTPLQGHGAKARDAQIKATLKESLLGSP